MSGTQLSISSNSTVSSIQVEGQNEMNTSAAAAVKNYIKVLLKSRIFLGRYIERRLTDKRIGYRDIVVLSAAEVELKRDLLEAKHKLRNVYPNVHWIGISDTEFLGYNLSSVCLWTEIDNQPFGAFWFQIKSIKFRDDEIIVALKCVRHITEAFLELEPLLTGGSPRKRKEIGEAKADTTSDTASLDETYNEIVNTLKSALTISNVKEFITFLFALVIAVFTGSTAFINFLGNFILALLREMSFLIKNSTPLFLGFLDFLSKIVGGFYILMAMIFKPSNPVPLKRSIRYDSPRRHNEDIYRDFD